MAISAELMVPMLVASYEALVEPSSFFEPSFFLGFGLLGPAPLAAAPLPHQLGPSAHQCAASHRHQPVVSLARSAGSRPEGNGLEARTRPLAPP